MYGFLILAIGCGAIALACGVGSLILTIRYYDDNIFLIGGCAICVVLALAFTLVGVLGTLSAREEYEHYLICYEMVQDVIGEGDELDNAGITQTIIEYNDWLAKALANRKAMGWFSKYVNCDLDALSFIRTGRD